MDHDCPGTGEQPQAFAGIIEKPQEFALKSHLESCCLLFVVCCLLFMIFMKDWKSSLPQLTTVLFLGPLFTGSGRCPG